MRYFYSDPLAAAWMAASFEMAYDSAGLVTEDSIASPRLFMSKHAFEDKLDIHCSDARGRRYYLHPDSVPLLKPKPGDLVKVMGEVGYVPTGKGFADLYAQRLAEANCQPHATGRIIQRDGKPFFWPESEAA
jgi:hypothetical protein